LWCKPHLPENLKNAIEQDDLEIWEWKVYQLPRNGKTYFMMHRSMYVFGYEDVDLGQAYDDKTEYVAFLTDGEVDAWREESKHGPPKKLPGNEEEAQIVEDWAFAEQNVGELTEGMDLKQAHEGMRADYTLTWLIKWIKGRERIGRGDVGGGDESGSGSEYRMTPESPSTVGAFPEMSDLGLDFGQDTGSEMTPSILTEVDDISKTLVRDMLGDFLEPEGQMSDENLEQLLRQLEGQTRQAEIEFERETKRLGM
jgi:hypothetical protein